MVQSTLFVTIINILNVSRKKFSIKHINNILLLTVAASGKEALTPVKIYIQAFELKNAKKHRRGPSEGKYRRIKT